jgi:hypothetical protein
MWRDWEIVEKNSMPEPSNICVKGRRKYFKNKNSLKKYFSLSRLQCALTEWDKILAEHPNDLMAIKFAQDVASPNRNFRWEKLHSFFSIFLLLATNMVISFIRFFSKFNRQFF